MSKFMTKKIFLSLLWILLFAFLCYSPYLIPASTQEKHLSILTWADILDSEVLKQFEQKQGIKIHLSYYASNEELLVKMKATEGEGYDLVIPSDYAVAKLVENNLLAPIQRVLIPNASKIDSLLMGQFYDLQNIYSLPFDWEVFGFGYNKEVFPDLEASWNLLFDPTLPFKYVMTNDPNEALQFASFHLFGARSKLSLHELHIVIDLLSAVRSRTEAYASFRADYFLATGSVPLCVTSSSYIWRSMKNYPFIGFKIPEEGSFVTIENLCLSKGSKNSKIAHKFIDFLYSDESMKKHFETYSFFPATLHQIPDLHLDKDAQVILEEKEALFKKLRFTSELVSQEKIQDAWVKIKVSSLP